MLLGEDGDRESFLREGSVSVEQVAEAVVQGLEAEQFLILPHPEVLEYFRRKARLLNVKAGAEGRPNHLITASRQWSRNHRIPMLRTHANPKAGRDVGRGTPRDRHF